MQSTGTTVVMGTSLELRENICIIYYYTGFYEKIKVSPGTHEYSVNKIIFITSSHCGLRSVVKCVCAKSKNLCF